MARNVYFDPFGAYTGGIQAGLQDGMNLERGVRDARLMDYQYNNVLPLELQGLQREENFNQWYDPRRRQVTDLGVDRARYAAGRDALDFARPAYGLTGSTAPLTSAIFGAYGLNAVSAPGEQGITWENTRGAYDPHSGYPFTYDPNGAQSLADFSLRPEAIETVGLNRQGEELQIARDNARTQQIYALMRQLQGIGTGTVPPEGDSWIE